MTNGHRTAGGGRRGGAGGRRPLPVARRPRQGKYVAVRASYGGTQRGPFGPFPATGRRVDIEFLGMLRIEDGRIAEMWVEWDNLNILTQLGLFPPPQ